MKILGIFFVSALLFITINSPAQKNAKPIKLKKSEKAVVENLKSHIYYLADDKLEGRRAGTEGETLAAQYVSNQFKEIGLEPLGTNSYLQAFEINDGKQVNKSTFFMVNGHMLVSGKDFFPMPYSPNISMESLPSVALKEVDMPWFIDLKDILSENASNPHFDLHDYIIKNAAKAKDRGATAIILCNTSPEDDHIVFDPKDRSEGPGIPVIYISKDAATKYFGDPTATLDIKLKIDIGDKIRTGHNVIGFINNNSPYTAALGAHFDHLGYGEDGNSMLRTGEKQIHNGADDNASGTAALIELARMLKESKNKNSNYLFIAFSAEELGLNGSKYFVDNPTTELGNINYMINMDMVGRLNDSSNALTVGGFGTSPLWSSLIKTEDKKSPLVIKIDSSGTGPSDHTSFYRKDIPVLFFFTGLHTDYHKPSDDADKINYTGELLVIEYIEKIITSANAFNQKLAFTKTRETQTRTSSRFSVTLGVMPDYTFTGSGLKIDGVSDGKAAQKAGLVAGDIIIQLGDFTISSMENYMQALGKFKTGDKTKLKYKRNEETKEADVQF